MIHVAKPTQRTMARMMTMVRMITSLFVVALWQLPVLVADEFPEAFNTDPADSNPPSPEEMVKLIDVPSGFNVTLFAGEPDVQQPIAMAIDDRDAEHVGHRMGLTATSESRPAD